MDETAKDTDDLMGAGEDNVNNNVNETESKLVSNRKTETDGSDDVREIGPAGDRIEHVELSAVDESAVSTERNISEERNSDNSSGQQSNDDDDENQQIGQNLRQREDQNEHDAVEADFVHIGFSDESGIKTEPFDEEDIEDTFSFDAEKRNELFARGLMCERKGKSVLALKCYLGCLNGLTQQTRFVLLPQCLRNIAEIYYQKQEYDRAIHFIQAEKLYYENALINTEEIQKKLVELHTSREDRSGRGSNEVDEQSVETVRAEEYEHLAKLCMDRKQTQLALEYAGKCTKLRQTLFGEQHPKTKESLDFFATVYAEVGKQQYSESMETLQRPEENLREPVFTDSDGSAQSTPTDGTPVSILRNRKNSEQEREKKQVRFHESVVDNSNAQQQERDENISQILVIILLLITFMVVTTVSLWVYCQAIDSNLCRSISMVVHDAYLNMRYKIYKYTSTKHIRFA